MVQPKMLTEDVVDDIRMVVDDLVHDQAEDAHLCCATVVEFDGALPELGLLVK